MRAYWKVPYINKYFLNKIKSKSRVIKLYTRSSTIPSTSVNKVLKVYNGIWYRTLLITPRMIGKKVGEFSHSRRVGTQKHLKIKSRKKSVTSKRRKQ